MPEAGPIHVAPLEAVIERRVGMTVQELIPDFSVRVITLDDLHEFLSDWQGTHEARSFAAASRRSARSCGQETPVFASAADLLARRLELPGHESGRVLH